LQRRLGIPRICLETIVGDSEVAPWVGGGTARLDIIAERARDVRWRRRLAASQSHGERRGHRDADKMPCGGNSLEHFLEHVP